MSGLFWIGGTDGDAMSPLNWSPGSPMHASAVVAGEYLWVASGSPSFTRTNMFGDTINYQNTFAGYPVGMNLNGGDNIKVAGNAVMGAPMTVNVAGTDTLNATPGLNVAQGTVDLAAHAHLTVTGVMSFIYDAWNGAQGSMLTNTGIIVTHGNAQISTLVNGKGMLAFSAFDGGGPGLDTISAPIGSGQTVDLNSGHEGLLMQLTDPHHFKGLLNIAAAPGAAGWIEVQLEGIKATSFSVANGEVTLKNGRTTVDTIRVANAGQLPITMSQGSDSTTLVFHTV